MCRSRRQHVVTVAYSAKKTERKENLWLIYRNLIGFSILFVYLLHLNGLTQ